MIGHLLDLYTETLRSLCETELEGAMLDAVFASMTDEQLLDEVTARTIRLLHDLVPPSLN